MFSVGDKIIYNESGVCTVETIAPLDLSDGRLYYHLQPLVGSGKYFSPVDSGAFMRPVISQEEAEALIAAIPDIEPAVCNDTRFNHVDAFYKELFRKHTPEALVSIIKGLRIRAMGKKAKSSRAEATMKRAKEALYGELSVALSIAYPETEEYVRNKIGEV
ncbi:MAG: CarD family transcriptional regulator [Oscillospiraceae bacterium]|nr:CarD family transcriptional regulator [Oscillospiraceae bacterium]